MDEKRNTEEKAEDVEVQSATDSAAQEIPWLCYLLTWDL